jgi:DNA-directed RNA polymerase subunit RPC12/RpoP
VPSETDVVGINYRARYRCPSCGMRKLDSRVRLWTDSDGISRGSIAHRCRVCRYRITQKLTVVTVDLAEPPLPAKPAP